MRAAHGLNQNQTMPNDVLEALGSRYKDIAYISHGATAAVFSAHDTNLDKPVAIKVLNTADERNLINFQKEAKSAAKLEHPNLVSILNFGKTNRNRAYLIMSFVDGKNLDEIVEEHGKLPLPIALNLLIQICDGLKHAHSKGIAHRDLKTSNIMVRNFETAPHAVIVDFGLAKEHDQEKSRTDTGAAVGSPLFMSPEQAQGKYGDERSDVYGLACIAFRIISGETPFYSEDMFDLLRQHIDEEPPLLSELAPAWETPEELDACLDAMLEKDIEKRTQTIKEVRDKLVRVRQIVEQKAEAGAQPQSKETASAPSVRNKAKTALRFFHAALPALAVAGLLAAASGMALFVLHDPHNSEAKAQSAHSSPVPVPEKDKFYSLKIEDKNDLPIIPKIKNVFRASSDTDYMERAPKNHYMPQTQIGLKDQELICFQRYTIKDPLLPVCLAHTNITGEGLKYLRTPHITVLDLSSTKLTSKGYDELVKLDNIERLALEDTNIDSETVGRLKDMKNLKALFLDGCKRIDDSVVKKLSKFPHLTEIGLGNTAITTDGIKHLKYCKNLEVVLLDSTQCDDDTAAELLKLPKLVDLQLNNCHNITDKTLTLLADTRGERLKGLGLSGTKITRKSFGALKRCPNLTWLSLGGVPLVDEDLEVIRAMKNLKNLQLSHLRASDDAIYKTIISLRKLSATGILYSNLSDESEKKIRMASPKCGLITDAINTDMLEDKTKAGLELILAESSDKK